MVREAEVGKEALCETFSGRYLTYIYIRYEDY